MDGDSLTGKPRDYEPRKDAVAWSVLMLDAIGEGVCLVNVHGTVLWANEPIRVWGSALLAEVARICRESGPALIGDTKPAREVVRHSAMASVGGKHFEMELCPLGPTSVESFARDPDCPLQLGQPAIAVIVRDSTASRELKRQIDSIDQAGSELVNLDADSVRKLNAHERLKFIEEKIIRFARDLLHFDHFAIRLLDDKTGKLELVMGHGLPPEFDLFEIYPKLEGCGISGYVAVTGRSYICGDVSKDDLFLPGVSGAKSSLTVPLKLNDRVIGIMNVESLVDHAFTERDRQLAEMFARYIAMSMHMLDLLVIERSTTNQSVSGRVEGELEEPLRDIAALVEQLRAKAAGDPHASAALERIATDVVSIRERVQDCARGPTTLLGVEKALTATDIDPIYRGKRILVADDEPKIRQILDHVLGHHGCVVTVCENGAKAIIEIDKAVEAGVRFDLVLSDIRMPDRNGYEVFSSVKRVMEPTPVILMTGFGYDPHHSIVRASQEGLQAVLFKPFPVERLLDEARKALQA
ncbi:MAG: response regulator [Phycisphaerales bacterium]